VLDSPFYNVIGLLRVSDTVKRVCFNVARNPLPGMRYRGIQSRIPPFHAGNESIWSSRGLSSPTAAARRRWSPPSSAPGSRRLGRARHHLSLGLWHHLDLEPHRRARPIHSSGDELIDLLLRQRAFRSTPLHRYFSSFPPLCDDSLLVLSLLSLTLEPSLLLEQSICTGARPRCARAEDSPALPPVTSRSVTICSLNQTLST
jgi:hypothetical protein